MAFSLSKIIVSGTREKSQWLGVLATLPEDPGSNLIHTTTHNNPTIIHNSNFRRSDILFWAPGTHVVNKHTQAKHSVTKSAKVTQ